MTSLAIGYKNAGGGKQSRTDGLMKHLGTIDAGSLRATDNQTSTLKLGQGLELLYDRPSRVGYIQVYDRETGAYLPLNLAGSPLTLPANCVDTAQLVPGAAQARIGNLAYSSGWTAANTGWQESPIQATVTTTGAMLRLEAVIVWQHTVAGASVSFQFYFDGAAYSGQLASVNNPGANYANTTSIIFYGQPGAGSHRFAVGVFNGAATFTLMGGTSSVLYVTEQRR